MIGLILQVTETIRSLLKMAKNIGLIFIVVSEFLAVALASSSEDLRNQLDSTLASKADLRQGRQQDLQ